MALQVDQKEKNDEKDDAQNAEGDNTDSQCDWVIFGKQSQIKGEYFLWNILWAIPELPKPICKDIIQILLGAFNSVIGVEGEERWVSEGTGTGDVLEYSIV